MKRILLLISSLAICDSAFAADLSMICESPRREYPVRFDKAANSLDAGETSYRVLAVEDTSERLVVVGLTVDQGPTFRAHFRPYRKMEYFTDNQLFQTDGCR